MTDYDFGAGLASLCRYIQEELKFSISHYNDDYIERRIHSRVRRSHTDTYSKYHAHLKEDETEQRDLLQSFSINVTGFYRNPDVWDDIRGILREKTAEGRTRVWSAGCADGREPYSLALLALTDPMIEEDNLSILATDINDEALEIAATGRYNRRPTEDPVDQLEFLSGYEQFVGINDDNVVVSDRVKELVTFEKHDIIRDEQFSGYDLILCRNLFIYIDKDYADEVFKHITDALNSGGYLIIGKAETVPRARLEDFDVQSTQRRVYRRK